MEAKAAIGALGTLAQEPRLTVFRLLVREGPSGLMSGTVVEQVGFAHSTLSHYLALLERAGLREMDAG